MAIIIASGTFSIAISSTSGAAAAVPAVKRPLPQPSSMCSSAQSGMSSRQWPRMVSGSFIISSAHFSMRGARFDLFLILMCYHTPVRKFNTDTPKHQSINKCPEALKTGWPKPSRYVHFYQNGYSGASSRHSGCSSRYSSSSCVCSRLFSSSLPTWNIRLKPIIVTNATTTAA